MNLRCFFPTQSSRCYVATLMKHTSSLQQEAQRTKTTETWCEIKATWRLLLLSFDAHDTLRKWSLKPACERRYVCFDSTGDDAFRAQGNQKSNGGKQEVTKKEKRKQEQKATNKKKIQGKSLQQRHGSNVGHSQNVCVIGVTPKKVWNTTKIDGGGL